LFAFLILVELLIISFYVKQKPFNLQRSFEKWYSLSLFLWRYCFRKDWIYHIALNQKGPKNKRSTKHYTEN